MILEKFSIGIGDRFGHQGKAQLEALQTAKAHGIDVVPVWNKSHREHSIIGTMPADTRKEADDAVRALHWNSSYYVDADHIGMKNVDDFIDYSDFFTIDVADFIGKPPGPEVFKVFMHTFKRFHGELCIPGIDCPFTIDEERLQGIGSQYLYAVKEAATIYRHICEQKGSDDFIAEVSMDEAEAAQTPEELFFILAMMAEEGIPAQTIAPKFTGRFNKGVDYVGNITRFTREFEENLAVIHYAVKEFSLPSNLKLSVHSGSDKFSIYKPIRTLLQKRDAGLHLKTAGTTWLEELIGLALAGGEALELAKTIYRRSLQRFDELAKPYAAVIEIDYRNLPDEDDVASWDGEKFANTLRHDPDHPHYNPHFRQLLHIGYKIAAELGSGFTNALEKHEDIISEQVTKNIYERHLRPLYIG
ncbi:hypothetical protein GF407_06295 [candidate division KSB1 bacterium]|nr:hypothetical protein [candidate division KSB1 bacterium]